MRGWSASDLAADIERRVAEHDLLPGDRLPPVRVLAAELEIAPNTVAGAYRRLGERGLTDGRGRMGTFVTARPPMMVPSDPEIPDGVLDLSSGNPDPVFLPNPGDVLSELSGSTVLYGHPSVDTGLAKQGASLLTADGIVADDIAVVSGGLDGLERVLQAHLRHGDTVAVEDPGYPPVADLIRALGLGVVPLAIDDEGPLVQFVSGALDKGVAAVVVTPRAQNPFGSAISLERAAALRSILNEYPQVLVIEDDHAAGVAGAPMYSIASGRERWATIRSAAKTYGPDVRLAVLAGDPVTIRRVEGRQRIGPGWVSHILQRLVAQLMSDGDTTAGIARAASVYASRRRTMLAALNERGLEAHGASGLNVWVPVPDELAAVRALEKRGFAVRAGSRYRIESSPGVRLTVAALDEAEIGNVADALHASVSELGPGTRSG
jgi:DNA-binding transcriptional MocR family regulator